MARWALVVSVLMLGLPAAAAELAVTVDAPEGRILPEVGSGKLQAHLSIDCQTAWLISPLGGQISVGLSLIVPTPKDVIVTGPTTVMIGPCPAPTGFANKTADFQVRMSRSAPGLEKIPIQLNATGPRGQPNLYPDQDASASFEVEGDYYSYIAAKSYARVAQVEPGGRASFQVTVSNLGNARTTLAFSLEEGHSHGDWQVELPDPVTLERAGSGPDSAAVEVVVQAPGGSGEMPFTVLVHPVATADATRQGEPVQFNLLVRVDSRVDAGPVASPSVFPLAMIAVAVLVARRRA